MKPQKVYFYFCVFHLSIYFVLNMMFIGKESACLGGPTVPWWLPFAVVFQLFIPMWLGYSYGEEKGKEHGQG